MIDPRTECTCPTEHTIARLGHCRSCPWRLPKSFEPLVGVRNVARQMGDAPRIVLVPEHVDGTPHDFEWATYADEQTSTGVCRCGLPQIEHNALVA
jgi:hypothetical protein